MSRKKSTIIITSSLIVVFSAIVTVLSLGAVPHTSIAQADKSQSVVAPSQKESHLDDTKAPIPHQITSSDAASTDSKPLETLPIQN